MMEYSVVLDEKEFTIDLTSLFQLNDIFRTYEDKLFTYIRCGRITEAEDVLLDFCMKALQLPKREKLFAVRFFFTSFITNIIRKQNNKGTIPPTMLAAGYDLINEVEQWNNISEYMLHISSFIKRIKVNITLTHLLFEGNELVQKALTIIYEDLTNHKLTVNVLANRLEVSTTHITNLFKKHLNMTPSEYIAKEKITAIITELRDTNNSLHTIRKKFGFSNHSHFIQFFKRQTDLTPLQYIQRHIYSHEGQ